MNRRNYDSWHLDKRVPVILICGMIIQVMAVSGIGVWYASKIDARIAELERWQIQLLDTPVKLAHIEQKLDDLRGR